MKYYTWDNKKNEELIAERKISFEEIIFYIEKGYLLDILEHPDQRRYRGQQIFVIKVRDYVYLIPFVEKEKEIFLKTIIPSRKATRLYLKEGRQNGKNG